MPGTDAPYDCALCGREGIPEDPRHERACRICLEEVCEACALFYPGDDPREPVRKICRACAEAAGLRSAYGFGDGWARKLRACREAGDYRVFCTVCDAERLLPDAVGIWKICVSCDGPVCPACRDPFAPHPLCSTCKREAEETAAAEAGSPLDLDQGVPRPGEEAPDSPLDLDGLLDLMDDPGTPPPPRRRLLSDPADDPACAHEGADPARHRGVVRALYEAVTGRELPEPAAPEPPAPPRDARASLKARMFDAFHPPIPFAAKGERCTVCRRVPPPVASPDFGATRFPATFPCTLCGKTICQVCKLNRKTGTWNIFCCEACFNDPRPVVVKSNPFRCWFEGSPPEGRGGINLARGAAGRAAKGLLGLLGFE